MLPVRVVIADRSALVRSVLQAVLDGPGTTVTAETSSVAGLLDHCRDAPCDVAVTQLDLDDGPLDPHVPLLLETGTAVLVLCDDESPERLTGVLEAGASGYLLYDSSPVVVADAVAAVAQGEVALHPFAAHTILEQWRRLRREPAHNNARRAGLTPREREVLAAMADGLATKAIARRLGVAVKTIENHKLRIFDKLGVRSQAHAVSLAIGHGLLSGFSPVAPLAESVMPAPVGGD